MTPYDQIIEWANNRWPIAVIVAAAGLIIYFSGLLKHLQDLYAKLFSGEKVFKKSGLEFVRIDAYEGNAYWKSSESQRVLDLKSKAEAVGDISGSHYEAADYLERSSLLVELRGRFDHDPNPTLDIIVRNNSASSKILLSYGLEVADARYRVISGGSVKKITLDDSDHYKIEFPLPKYVKGESAKDEVTKTIAVPAESYSGKGALCIGDINSPDLDTFWEWEWAETPVVSMSKFANPPQLDSEESYRFTLEIDKSERMPTDTLLRIAIQTDDGEFRSDHIYFLKP